MMNRLGFLAVLTLFAGAVSASEWPYDENANAAADVQHALSVAQTDHKQVLLVFGANWCKDCRELDKAMKGSSHALIERRYEVVKIDVGNFDKNLDIAQRYGNPIKMGIPAIAVVDADNHLVYATKGGELADARSMGEQGIYNFLSSKLAASPSSNLVGSAAK